LLRLHASIIVTRRAGNIIGPQIVSCDYSQGKEL
jgi:hypothetical protein